jgi:phage-related minor tail protein
VNRDHKAHAEVVKESWQALAKTADEMTIVDAVTTGYINKLKAETEEVKRSRKAFEDRREEIAKTTQTVKEQSEFMKEFNSRVQSWAKDATNLGKTAGEIVTKTFDGIADGTARAFRESLEEGKSFTDSMKQMFRKLLFDISEDIMRSGIKNALAQIFGLSGGQGGFGGFGGGGGGGFNFGSILSSIGGFFGGFKLFGHKGGMVTPRGIQVLHSGGFAGLRPDEVPAILQTGERVLSRSETAGYARPQIVNHNYTIYALDSQSFAEYVRRNKAPILGVVNQDLMEDGRTRSNVRRFGR